MNLFVLHLQGQLELHHDSITQGKYSLLSRSVAQELCQGEGCQVPQGMERLWISQGKVWPWTSQGNLAAPEVV